MPTFHFYKNGSRVDEMQGADPGRLQSTVERLAPSSAEVSFSGTGHQLGGSSSSGPPQVNWDSPAAQDEIKKRREAMAAAASQRYTAPKNEEPKPTSDEKPAAASSSAANVKPDEPDATEEKVNDPRLNIDQALLKQMLEMGFPQVRAEKALILTGNKSLEPAMEWCFEHADDADIDEPLAVVSESGKPKPVLSEEERKARANEALLKARKRREEEDLKASHERERNRIRSGKEVAEAKRKHEENERKRAVEAKRKEKREAALEKKRVQELVAADRAARREKFGKKPSQPAPPQEPVQTEPKAAAPPAGGKLQLRFSDGTRAERHFEPENTLGDVVDAVLEEKPGTSKAGVRLATMYPRRTFEQDEYDSTLVDLKLLPRGVLNVTI